MNILIAEDEAIASQLLQLTLKHMGHEVVVARRILWFTREVHQLKQLIPICAYCHKIHTAKDYWQRFETYINQQTGSEFSHGMCPECFEVEMTKLKCAK